jgi:hypothetical protein
LLSLGGEIAQGGGPPSPEQAQEMGQIQARLKVFARSSLGLIAVAALTMSIARYL